MNFSTKSVTAEVPNTGSKYLAVGINDNCTLMGFEAGESSKGTPFLEVTILKGEDSSAKDKFYFSENAQEKSQQKVLHLLVDGLGISRDAVDAAGAAATSLADYAKKLSQITPHTKLFRMKFSGEQYESAGSIKTAKRIGFIPFAEAMDVLPTKLKYDQGNKYDFKAMVQPDADFALAASSADAGLPF